MAGRDLTFTRPQDGAPPGRAAAVSARLRIGVDVGSITVKAVVADAATGAIVWRRYERHEGRQPETVLSFLQRIERDTALAVEDARIFITGSGGNALADSVGAKFVQEVNALALAAEHACPTVGSVVELGGQDAKFVLWLRDTHTGATRKFTTMNDKCAGGTGAVIDKIAAKLGVTGVAVGRLAYTGVKLHPVAGKCGVFAESDINGLQKQGVPAEELMASLFDALVQQNLSVLTRGHTLRPTVLLLGGPHAFLPGLCDAWRSNIMRLWATRPGAVGPDADPEALIVVPPDSLYFAALGAVLFGASEEPDAGCYQGTAVLAARVANRRSQRPSGLPGLVRDDRDLTAFQARYARPLFAPPVVVPGAHIDAAIGVDAGSTSTKAVLLDRDARVRATAYQLSCGSPVEDVRAILGALHDQIARQGATLDISAVGITGYAKDLLKDPIGADLAIVETVAHARAAQHFHSDVDVIVDVGGQDIKVCLLRGGRVQDFRLNTQCSAGNGYFLQATAAKFGYDVTRYADVALGVRCMPLFGYGCAVFLESEIVNAQQLGWSREEILAGLAAVLPKNIWLYVVQEANLARLGRRFVLQGGTHRNLAVVKAQRDFIVARVPGAEVLVHEHCGEAGAIGAALEAMRTVGDARSRFVGFPAVAALVCRTTRDESTRCHYCRNRCLRTFVDTDTPGIGRQRHVIATCDTGAADDVRAVRRAAERLTAVRRANPNFVELGVAAAFARQDAVRAPRPRPRGRDVVAPGGRRRWAARRHAIEERRARVTVGMPRVLDLYACAPYFVAYFESVGIPHDHVVWSPVTNEALWREGSRRGAIDPCFPSKVAMAHVHWLLFEARRRPDVIFFPALLSLPSELEHTVDASACPAVSGTPQVVKAAFTMESDLFAERAVTYCDPVVHMAEAALCERELLRCFGPLLGVQADENAWAVRQGVAALQRVRAGVRRHARAVLDALERDQRVGIVVLGRPYHADPGLHHGILEQIQALGYPIFGVDSLPTDPDLLQRLFGDELVRGVVRSAGEVGDVWKNSYAENTNRKLWAAKYAARHPNLVALDVSSFKCGHDAPIAHAVEAILAATDTPVFTFHDLDENRPAASFKLRVETMSHFLSDYQLRLRRKRATTVGPEQAHFRRPTERPFTDADRDRVTVLFGGLTETHDRVLQGALAGLGLRAQCLPTPDTEALHLGKEFCNRGLCNPTYYTVGALLKYLRGCLEAGEVDVARRYALLTAGSCGPCRFGMYEAAYRHALHGAGFGDLRVLTGQQTGGIADTEAAVASGDGALVDRRLFFTVLRALLAGDLLNAAAYQIRPYEVVPGQTNRVLDDGRAALAEAFQQRHGVWPALRRIRAAFTDIDVDLTRLKPKVKIIGEFWAQTTEGDGSYRLPGWLEAEGAEVLTEPLAAWFDYLFWWAQTSSGDRCGIAPGARRNVWHLRVAHLLYRGLYQFYRSALGFRTAPLDAQPVLARLAAPYYNPRIAAGEGHLEVAKHLRAILRRRAHMVVSVKPFGCLPSTQSDGVQAKVVAELPATIFLAVETSGDGEVNVKSRIQMKLHEARALAAHELQTVLRRGRTSLGDVREYVARRTDLRRPLQRLPDGAIGTAANFVRKVLGQLST